MNMACQFLDLLPREIRDQIYASVLSPTGRITIRPNHPCDTDTPALVAFPAIWPYTPFDMNITRTCKKINRECRGVFWQTNTLVVDAKLLDNADFVNTFYTSWAQLRRIELRFSLNQSDMRNVLYFLHPVDTLSRRGRLQEVRFTIGGTGTMHKFKMAVKSRREAVAKLWTTMADIHQLLEKAGHEKHGCLAHLTRSLDLRLGAEHLSDMMRREWFEGNPARECEDAFGSMHDVLGGDLLLDGVLCYREGVRVREGFELLARVDDQRTGERQGVGEGEELQTLERVSA